jgi:peptide/nickel transport system substrate-binding protein
MKKMLFVLLALVLVLTACGPAAAPAATEAPAAQATPKKLIVGFGTEDFPRLGWTVDSDDAFSMSYLGIIETLTRIDYEGNIVPGLAESWKQVDDTTWEFTLRSGVSFTNGEPLNAAAVVKALQYILNSPTPPRGISKDNFKSIKASGDSTVVIKTAVFDILIPDRLAGPNAGILAPSAYIATSGPIDPFNTGTGPFILTKEVPNQSLDLVKNPNYWGGKVNIDNITVLFVPDPQVRAGMLQTGEIDLAIHLPPEQLAVLEGNSNLKIIRSPAPRDTTLYMNNSRKPFNDLKVRQAVAYALDKAAIVDATLEGAGTPGVGPFSPVEVWVNKELTGYPYDPEKAKALLAEAGYKEGELNLSVWTYPDRANLPTTAVAIQDMLYKIGINVDIRVAQYDPMMPDIMAGNYDMFIMSRGHSLDTYDPEGWFSEDYSCKGGFNVSLFCDENFDQLLEQTKQMTDPIERYNIYHQLQSILVDQQCVSVFLNYTEILDGMQNNVLNFKIHPTEQYVLTAELDIEQ